jgi:hypothetical protein
MHVNWGLITLHMHFCCSVALVYPLLCVLALSTLLTADTVGEEQPQSHQQHQ